jgi:hypothetical protein
VPSRGSSGSSIRPARLPLRNSSSKPPFQILGHSIPIHKHRNLLAHAPQRLHEEVSADDNDMIYATSAAEIEAYRRAFIRKWRLKCKAVADSLEEAGDRLFTFTRLPVSQWKSARTTDEMDKLFSVSSLAGIGPCSQEGHAALSVRRRHGSQGAVGMRLCQRRQPPKAVAAGQRLQSCIPTATVSRGARRAALVKATATAIAHCPPREEVWCALWYRRLARATAWRRARLEDEGLAALGDAVALGQFPERSGASSDKLLETRAPARSP